MRKRIKKSVPVIIRSKKSEIVKKISVKGSIPREMLEFDEFLKLLECITLKKSNYAYHKRRAAFALLFMTGLRCGNLLKLTVGQVEKLLKGEFVTIHLIKKRSSCYAHRLRLSSGDLEFLKKEKLLPSLEHLGENKNYDSYFFSNKMDSYQVLHLTTFEKDLNEICSRASLILKKHIRTHSFRITHITMSLMKNPIEAVQNDVGHSDIKHTLVYDRRLKSEAQQALYETNLDSCKYLYKTRT